MKKISIIIVLCILLFVLVGCQPRPARIDSLNIVRSDENVKIGVNGEYYDSYKFEEQNKTDVREFDDIDFYDYDSEHGDVTTSYRFSIVSSESATYNLSLELVDANRYLIDLLRVAIVIDGGLIGVYKYNNWYDPPIQRIHDPEFTTFFESKKVVFNQLSIDTFADTANEIAIYVWFGHGEMYNVLGQRYTGWFYWPSRANNLQLNLEISKAQ